jgi:hypothetical protein
MEGVLEPSAVVALLSLVATFRWRMYALGASSVCCFYILLQLGPDRPIDTTRPVLGSRGSTLRTGNISGIVYIKTLHSDVLTLLQKSQGLQPIPYLSFSLLEQINATHAKALKNESYKVHKAIMHRPEDYETETMNIDVFVRGIVSAGKDGIGSLRYVWTGKARKERKKDREEEKDTEGEGDDVSEHIGRMLRKGAGNVHALASGVVDEVKDGIKELSGLAKSRKGTDALPTFKITQ